MVRRICLILLAVISIFVVAQGVGKKVGRNDLHLDELDSEHLPTSEEVQRSFRTGNHAARYMLKKELFDNYDSEIAPPGVNDSAVIITVELFGAILIEIKETEQIASHLLSHNQKWKDSRLSWDPQKYNGIKDITIPKGKLWRPDTYIYNSIEVKDLVDEQKDLARVSYTGEIDINCPQYVQAFCTVGVHMFPFDTQFCTIAVTSNQLMKEEMDVQVTLPKFNKYKFTGNSEWDLMNVSMVYHDLSGLGSGLWGPPGVEYQYIFQICRRPTYYITVIIIPIFLIATLSIVGIFAPGSKNETGNCVNLGLGTLLALMVLLGIVADRLPKSDDMPLLGYYILAILICFVFCVIFETMFLYYSHSLMQTGKKPPKWIYKLTRVPMQDEDEMRGKAVMKIQQKQGLILMSGTKIEHSNGILKVPVETKTGTDELSATLKSLRELVEEQRKILLKCDKDDEEKEIEDEWEKVENRIDFIWIFFFEALNVFNLILLMIFVSAPSPSIEEWLYGKTPIELLTS